MQSTTETLTAQEVFAMAVAEAASKALTRYPDDAAVITRAVRLIALDAVMLRGSGVHEVRSATGEHVYAVNGACECEAFQRGMVRCKHRLAVALYKHALAELQDDAEREWTDLKENPFSDYCEWQPLNVEPTPEPEPVSLLPEAPASVNCYIEIAGRQVQITLRDFDEARLLQRLAALLAQYPVPEKALGDTQPAPAESGKLCPVHQVPMRRHQNDRGHWFSHKASDGSWCRGK